MSHMTCLLAWMLATSATEAICNKYSLAGMEGLLCVKGVLHTVSGKRCQWHLLLSKICTSDICVCAVKAVLLRTWCVSGFGKLCTESGKTGKNGVGLLMTVDSVYETSVDGQR
jgi:hypothetical protein